MMEGRSKFTIGIPPPSSPLCPCISGIQVSLAYLQKYSTETAHLTSQSNVNRILYFLPSSLTTEKCNESLLMLMRLLKVFVGSLADGGGYGNATGLGPKKLRSLFSPNKNDSGCGDSNFSPPMMKWEAKYALPPTPLLATPLLFFGG